MTQYDFRLSLRSNDPKVVATGEYLSQFDDMRHRILAGMVDQSYPIALCLDPTKSDQEVLLALIESLSNDAAQMAYKVNFIKASRGINITSDMLSNFGLLPSIQYSSVVSSNIADSVSEDQNVATPTASPVIADLPDISIVKKDDEEEIEEEEDEDDDPYEGMSDEEYLEATKHLRTGVNIK